MTNNNTDRNSQQNRDRQDQGSDLPGQSKTGGGNDQSRNDKVMGGKQANRENHHGASGSKKN